MSWLTECAFICGLLAACYGWGLPVARLAGTRPGLPFLTAAQGLALLAVLGGWLNLFGLASAAVVAGLVPAGLTLALAAAALHVRRAGGLPRLPAPRAWRDLLRPGLLFWIIPLGLLLFLAAAILPPSALNYHDDFMKYLARTMRMLQTGSIWGDIFDPLGLDSFGAQDFLNGLVVSLRGAGHANALDSVFCPVLACLLLRDLAAILGRGAAWAILPACALLSVNPQDVNISALYSGAACLLGLLISLSAPGPAEPGRRYARLRSLASPALFLAVLSVLKNSLLSSMLLVLLASLALALALPGQRAARIRQVATLAGLAFLLAFPWLVYLASYQAAALAGGVAPAQAGAPLPLLFRGDLAQAVANFLVLFTPQASMYGSSYLTYTAYALGILAAGALDALPHDAAEPGRGWLRPAAGLAVAATYFGYPWVMAHVVGLRYHMPLLLGLFPASLLLVQVRALPPRAKNAAPVALLLAMAAATALGLPGLAHRLDAMARTGNELAFDRAHDPAYLRYCRDAMSPQHAAFLRSIQARIPAGSRLFTWMSTPFALDYRRNPVLSPADCSGLALPWLGFPVGAGLDDFRNYLRSLGVDYVLWERKGYGMIEIGVFSQELKQASRFDLKQGRMRDWALAALYLDWILGQALDQAQPLYDDGSLVLFRP